MAREIFRERNGILADLSIHARNSVALQQEMFRLAEHEHGLSLAVLSRTRGIPLSTLKGWRDGAQMPAWAIGELRLPDDLTSLILTPWDKFIGSNEDGEGDLDALGLEALGLAGEVAAARSPASPGGTNIVPMERAKIADRARRMVPRVRGAAVA
jgi:hypothetical protein